MTTRTSNRTKRLLKRLGALTLVLAIASALLFITVPFLKSNLIYFLATRPLDNQNASWREQQEAQDYVDGLCETNDTIKWLSDSKATKTGATVKRIMVIISLAVFATGIYGYYFIAYAIWRDIPIIFPNTKLAGYIKSHKKLK